MKCKIKCNRTRILKYINLSKLKDIAICEDQFKAKVMLKLLFYENIRIDLMNMILR